MKKFHILMLGLAFIFGDCKADEKEKPEEENINAVLDTLRAYNTDASIKPENPDNVIWIEVIPKEEMATLRDNNRKLTAQNEMLVATILYALSSVGWRIIANAHSSNLCRYISDGLAFTAGGIFSIFLWDYTNNLIRGI